MTAGTVSKWKRVMFVIKVSCSVIEVGINARDYRASLRQKCRPAVTRPPTTPAPAMPTGQSGLPQQGHEPPVSRYRPEKPSQAPKRRRSL